MRLALIRLSTLAFEASASADSANPAYKTRHIKKNDFQSFASTIAPNWDTPIVGFEPTFLSEIAVCAFKNKCGTRDSDPYVL